ncbi:Replication initiation protein [Psychrobacter pasteurii]|uniref:Replication initiation protein n=1 Tax=Psychrobacter pasteurii TaxID=1945520 RepID=A0A1R4EIS8_9GAMM|nr:replication initiation protein [Psychrobacter pasteurii]SJM38392.1 Replication initiation protein [Psychrobacter pasteurii]
MKDNLVAQSNNLVSASYIMTTLEKELLLACISKIDSRPNRPVEVTKQTKFTISVKTMKELFYNERTNDNAYRDLRRAANRLFEREVTIKLEDNQTLRTRFVSGIRFDPKKAQITVTFAEDILPYLTELSANFTKYRLHEVAELSSVHSMRLYELIVMWTNQFQYSKELDLDDFKELMGVQNSYKQFGQLREFVIEKAINEINQKTNYKVSVSYKKVSRSFVGLTLSFYKKTLDKIACKNGTLSQDKIKAIVNSVQFMNDYNDHPKLSYEGKMNTDAFKREMMLIIQREPESFNKKNKGLESYLAPIKNGN